MILEEPIYKKENCVAYSTCSVNKDYLVRNGDEHFYHFVGKVSGISFIALVHPDYIEEFDKNYKSLKPGQTVRMLLLLINYMGEYNWTDLYMTGSLHSSEEDPIVNITMYMLSACESRYISDLNNLNKYRLLLSLHQNYLFDYDSSSEIFSIYFYNGNQSTSFVKLDVNSLYKKVLNHITDAGEKADFEQFYAYVKDADKGFSCNVTLPIDSTFTTFRKFKASASIFYTENRTPYVTGVLFGVDIDSENIIPYYATREALDSATGLLNKRASTEYTEFIINSNDGKPHYMIIFDVDNFKNVNDIYGHLFGDEVLNKVANVIKRVLSGRGVTGRFGGDEFYIFTDNIHTEEELRIILTTMRRELQYAYEGIVEDFSVTLSIGISLYPTDGTTYEELFKKADKCLYLAKNKGRNRFIIYDEAKHGGALVQEGRHAHKVLDLAEHAEYMANIIADASLNLNATGSQAIPHVMDTLFNQMEMDGIRIYCPEKSSESLFTYGSYKTMPYMKDILADDSFNKRFNTNNVLSVGNTATIDGWHKKLHKELTECNIMAFTAFRFIYNDRTYIFFYDIFNHKSRWNDSDKNYLLIISKMIAVALSRH